MDAMHRHLKATAPALSILRIAKSVVKPLLHNQAFRGESLNPFSPLHSVLEGLRLQWLK